MELFEKENTFRGGRLCKYKVQASESEGFGDGLKDLPPRVKKNLQMLDKLT